MDGENQNPMEPHGSQSAAEKPRVFLGSYTHSLDNKGRVIVPYTYRYPLGETFTVGPTMDFSGIALYPNTVFDKLLTDLMAMNQRKPVVQMVKDQFAKLSYNNSQIDAQGRLLLPTRLRQRMLGDEKEVEISGAVDYIRVMSGTKVNTEDTYFTEHLKELLEELGNLSE